MPQTRTLALTRPAPAPRLVLSLLALAGALWAHEARSQEAAPTEAAATAPGEGGTIVSHGYNFFGELKYPEPDFVLDYVNPDAPKGGEIAIAAEGTFDSFNPFTIAGGATAYGAYGVESILTSTADDPTSLYCLICSSMEYPEDLSWVIFTLRPEARFADGSPLTAEDVKFSHDLFMEQGLESYRLAAGGMVSNVEVLDPHRIRFTFADDAPMRDRIGLAGGLSVLSKAWFEETGQRLDEPSDQPLLGSGPYMVENFDFSRRILIGRNPDYWGKNLPINVGRNNFDRIRVEYFADSNVAFEAFKAGEYTFRVENSSLLWATGYNFPALEQGWVFKGELPNGGLPVAQSFVFNLRRETFQDPRVREALGLMFNFEWSNETLFYDLYTRTVGFWNESELMAQGAPSEGEVALLQPLVDEGLLDASILTEEAVVPPVSSPERQADRGNIRQASQLLDEAGWIVGDDGVRRKDGQTLDVVILEDSPTFDRVINPYVENLQRIGVNARLDRVDPAQMTQRRDESDFDMTAWGFQMSLEPSTGLEQWFGSESAAESNRNLMGLQDPAVDRLIAIAVAADTRETMVTAVNALDRVLRAKRFWVPQWYKASYTVAYYDMFEHPETLPPYDLGYLDFWWYNADKAEALRTAGAFQ
ncbi:ABC transporter substrate-binding protein [Rubellimicrobium rubrum]|uniref:ABC transporter substrate-binding protein n=1 Tax=Rubellimicrobium rubrum TaxID=2585369 RepID=A0A5C4MTX3_9RHOB|nr:extracellular solute-binding protein [Rubellimicrobium rubrum]TNC49344.1 ABC transporter substrate-binding protein [Rubellimicrobium rubrum]